MTWLWHLKDLLDENIILIFVWLVDFQINEAFYCNQTDATFDIESCNFTKSCSILVDINQPSSRIASGLSIWSNLWPTS